MGKFSQGSLTWPPRAVLRPAPPTGGGAGSPARPNRPARRAASLVGVSESPATAPSPAVSLRQWLMGTGGQVPEGWLRPRPSRRGVVADAVLALLMTGLLVLSWSLNRILGIPEADALMVPEPVGPWVPWAFPAAFGLGLGVRRIVPISGLAVTTTAFIAGQTLGYNEYLVTQVAMFMSFYSAGAWSRHRRTVTVLRLLILAGMVFWSLVGFTLGFLHGLGGSDPDAVKLAAGAMLVSLVNIAFFAGALVFGSIEHRRAGLDEAAHRRRAAYRAQAEQLRAERATVAEQAVRLDRVAIARDLHDIVAHHVSLMGLQAAAARRTLDADPQRARGALLAIEESARTAVAELQDMLATLRGPEEAEGQGRGPNENAPSTHSIERLGELVEEYRAAGGRIVFHRFGPPRQVPPGIAITAYRILQESLTNVRKHAGRGVETDVRLRYLEQAIELEVGDRGGRAAPSPAVGCGRGITGMRERALAVRGTLEAGPRPAGGFRVRALLPTHRPAQPAVAGAGPLRKEFA